VFILRTSSTSVTTWFWQTEGRSAERVILGVRPSKFILLELQSPLRRIFIGSHSLPPSGRLIGPSTVMCSGGQRLVAPDEPTPKKYSVGSSDGTTFNSF
jgi:hypothetical protein